MDHKPAVGALAVATEPKDPEDPNDPDDAAPESLADRDDSKPIASGAVPVVAGTAPPFGSAAAGAQVPAVEPVEPVGDAPTGRAHRISGLIQSGVSGGVEKLGSGIGTLGEGMTKLGELTEKVPLVGAGVTKLGEGLARAGESIQSLPRVAQTRRGRLLLRSVIVGFLLVSAWIAVIVAWQVKRNDTPDFRPDAERILVELSKGSPAIEKVYEAASPRFQENVSEERFVDDMTDMNATFGKFHEITAINGTLVTTGPTGPVGRVSLTAAFDNGVCKGSIDFHKVDGTWRFFGINVELPAELTITQAQREQRVAVCKDPMDPRTCELNRLADSILQQLRDGKAGEVWDGGDDIFKQQETRDRFIAIQADRRAQLGAYKRILDITEAKLSKSTARTSGGLEPIDSVTLDLLAEFEKSSGVRTVLGFQRHAANKPWRLHSIKIVVPMPRPENESPNPATDRPPPPPPPAPADAGVRDGARK
jgi:hypothetical protein